MNAAEPFLAAARARGFDPVSCDEDDDPQSVILTNVMADGADLILAADREGRYDVIFAAPTWSYNAGSYWHEDTLITRLPSYGGALSYAAWWVASVVTVADRAARALSLGLDEACTPGADQ